LKRGTDTKGVVLPGFEGFGSEVPPRAWYLAYQSKGNRPGAWLGPDLDDLIDAAADSPVTGIIVCPIGFMTDHMETMYDLDIVAADRALQADLEFVRVSVPNQDPVFMKAVADMLAELV
jgi:ferrochelatase